MSLYAVDPVPLKEFVAAFEQARRAPNLWPGFLQELGRFREPSAHFSVNSAQNLAAPEELEEQMVATALPSMAMQALVSKLFARWTARVSVGLGDRDFFGYPYRVPKERPEISTSLEWRHVVDTLLCPGRIPSEFSFLSADPDNSVACCMSPTEVADLLRLERQERLIENGIILYGRDAESFLGLLNIAASQRCMIWHYEQR